MPEALDGFPIQGYRCSRSHTFRELVKLEKYLDLSAFDWSCGYKKGTLRLVERMEAAFTKSQTKTLFPGRTTSKELS